MDKPVPDARDDDIAGRLIDSNLDLVVEIAKGYDDLANNSHIIWA